MTDNKTQKTNRGALFPNQSKTKPNHPDFTGRINIEGKELNIAAWKNPWAKNNSEYLSIIISEIQQNNNMNNTQNNTNQNNSKSITQEEKDILSITDGF